jgi:hypothetical protein
MYEQYQNAADALRHERSGRRHAEAVLEGRRGGAYEPAPLHCATYPSVHRGTDRTPLD